MISNIATSYYVDYFIIIISVFTVESESSAGAANGGKFEIPTREIPTMTMPQATI